MLAHLSHRGVIKLTGKDVIPFLNGLISQNTHKLSEEPLFSAFLTPQGKFLYDLFLIQHDDAIFVDLENIYIPEFIRKLSMFKLRSDVEIETTQYQVFVSNITPPLPSATILFTDPRLPDMGYRIYSDVPLPSDKKTFDTWDQHRIQLSIPDGTRDIPYDRGVILEYGFDELKAIDWQKGCYLGQELTARTRYRGLIRKRLLPLKLETGLTFSADIKEITHHGKSVGELRSFNGNVGLALMYLESFFQDGSYTFKDILYNGSPINITIPDWMRLPEVEA